MVRHRVRIRFRKEDGLRLIGHRDLLRTVERLFRRAELPLRKTEGFHPRPRIHFPSPLAVGIRGMAEVLEVELSEPRAPEELFEALSAQSPPGLQVASVELCAPEERKAVAVEHAYQIAVPPERHAALAAEVKRLAAASSCPIQRRTDGPAVDLCELLVDLKLEADALSFRLRVGPQGGLSPRDVLGQLGLADLEQQGCVLTRTHVELGS